MKKLNEIFDTNVSVNIKNIKTNTQEVEKGDLFVCVKGFTVDRHDLVKDAEKKGAAALVVDHKVDSKLPQIVVKNTNNELLNIVTKFYDYPADRIKMIGVTGTDGKTSTATIVYEFLNQISKCGYIGTNGVNCPDYEDSSNNTTPGVEHLHRFFNTFIDKGCNYVCMESSSEALAQGRCESIKYDYAIFTNLTHEHLNFHKNMRNYLKAKGMLFKQTKKEGYSIINIDDPYGKKISKFANNKVLFYGSHKKADLRFHDVKIKPTGTTFKLDFNNETYNIKSPLLGMFNVYNLTAALGVILTMGIDIKKLDFSKLFVDGRMINIDLGQDYKVIVDYAHTPNGYHNLFALVNTLKFKRTIIVAGSAGERDHAKRSVMGKILVENADHVIFTYEDPRSEDPNDIIDDLTSEITHLQDKYERVVDRKAAIKKAINMAKKNDMILILGKGNETYEVLKDGKIYFNDIEEAKKAIKNRKRKDAKLKAQKLLKNTGLIK